ncbi:GLPGLI family protein [Porphyromonas macacae]|nr:GLPGLI family protein [Porphyromonas macacae]
MKVKISIIICILLLFCAQSNAQSYRAMYEGEEVNLYDGEVIRDLFILDISKSGKSLFQSYYSVKRDSIRDVEIKRGIDRYEILAQMRNVQPGTKNKVFFDPQKKSFTEIDHGGIDYFKTSEQIKERSYTFADSTKVVAGYFSNAAIVSLYGREWVVYYTTEISMPYGPWKINGLPGLVTEAYTTDGAYRFTLTGFEKMAESRVIEVPFKMNNQPVLEVSHKEMLWIRKLCACKDPRPILKKYSKGADMSQMYHDKIDKRYRELAKRYQYIEKE